MSRRSTFLQLQVVAYCLLIGLSIAGCKPKTLPKEASSEEVVTAWRTHLGEHTQGWVSADNVLRFHFTHPVVGKEQLNKPLDGIVKLDPAQDAVAVFTADDTMELRHPQRFVSGSHFDVILLPDQLQNLPNSLQPLRYTLNVLQQEITLRETGLVTDAKSSDKMRLDGELETADSADKSAVEKILTANHYDKTLPVIWKHLDERRHQFSVENIERGTSATQLRIQWDATAIGASSKGEKILDIPAAKTFEFTSVRAVQSPDTYVEVRFSDALDASQNLSGLARIDNQDARAQIDGNALRIYGSNGLKGTVSVYIDAAVHSAAGKKLADKIVRNITFTPEIPAVRFAETGNIMPAADRLSIPIEAVAINAVQVRAFEIYPDNIGQYLQSSNLNYKSQRYIDNYNQRDVGRYLWQKTVTLPHIPANGWERFDLDVSDLMKDKKGSLLRLEVEVLPQFSSYACAEPPKSQVGENVTELNYEGFYKETSVPENLQRYYESAGYYDWDKRSNPCDAGYYVHNDKTLSAQMFFASSIGLLAKQGGDNQLHVLATDLRSAKPLPDAEITAYNYQQQRIGAGKADTNGLVTLAVEGVPFYIKAEKDGDIGYLKVPRNNSLPTSQFDTGGTKPEQGLKGFFYGERDIWRPGDEIFLTFVLMDKDKKLPENYPVTLEFFDARGGKVKSITNATPVGGFYTFQLATNDNAPTGNWRAIVKIGDHYFDKVIKIENIAPNHLKMDLTLPETGLRSDAMPFNTTLQAQWLNGATAASLKADIKVRLSASKTKFSGLDGYQFDDKARSFTQEPQTVFEGQLDANGQTPVEMKFELDTPPPGVLNAVFTQRVFEPGGQFSSQYRSTSFYPFNTFVGIHSPAGNSLYEGALDKDSNHLFDLVTVDATGKPVANRKLQVTLYRIEWRWWWEDNEEDFSRYVSNDYHRSLETQTVSTDATGHATWTLEGAKYEWGRHLVRVCDADESGVTQHCSSQDIYLGYGYGDKSKRDASTRMSMTTDKERYLVGDEANVQLPPGPDRQVFVSLENGNRVLSRYWQTVKNGEDHFSVKITPEMSPNVYVHVTQLQAHEGRNNDLPIRLYGIVPLMVDDPATHLSPQIEAPEKVRPESALDVSVSEAQGHPMTYTLALVDEGLLGVTDYRTPDPHDTFYRREALGVLTWDLFDMVIGAYGADLSRLLAIGGSDTIKKRDSNRERRFPPIVKFYGPFQLAAGEKRVEHISLPPYMGAVRLMVVAGDGHAFGKSEKTVTVTQPLTLLSTLPRVLGPGEELDLPVTAFVSEAPFGIAKIRVTADDFFTVLKGEESAPFEKPGEATVRLRLKVNERVGMAKIIVNAEIGGETAHETINIPVRTANLPSVKTETHVLQPGETWQPQLVPHGMLGTNVTTLTASRAPELKLEERLQYLVQYPHGCIEQTTSSVFPQLYLGELAQLNTQQTSEIEHNIQAGIDRIATFQTASGGFSYWPYQPEVSAWGNDYAGHFLLEAKRLGYSVPPALLNKWLAYQQEQARNSNASQGYERVDQAYRLYTLALGDQPDTGAMNRLRDALKSEANNSSQMTRWLLALAYQQVGLKDVALELLQQAGTTAHATDYDYWYYGSALRDEGVLLLLQHKLGQTQQAWQLAQQMANGLATDNWYSTHSTAWALTALAQTFGNASGQESRFAMKQGNGEWQSLVSQRVLYQQGFDQYQNGSLSLRNDGSSPLYLALSNRGMPANTEEQPVSQGLSLDVHYTDMQGQPLDVHSLKQGQDFMAEVTVQNLGDRHLDNLSLTQVVASGWQIRNTRLEGAEQQSDLDYQDVRDDRLLSYFPLAWNHGKGSYYWPDWWHHYDERHIDDTVTVKMLLNASFAGRFYLPGWRAEAMYDATKQAASTGQWVEVTPQ
ncbi:MAG TPA: MG2 domain-containing protein [Cellvibrio sp.]|nr:MG2 domain-containing protein [Cellvibrio sp.]